MRPIVTPNLYGAALRLEVFPRTPSRQFYKYLKRRLKSNSAKDIVFFYILRAEEQEKQRLHLKKLGMDPTAEDSLSGYLKTKLMGAVRTTKENPYVRSLYSEFSNISGTETAKEPATTNTTTSGIADALAPPLPADTAILLYPSYTKVRENEFITRVKGSIYCNGSMSTKNRLLLGLAQRLTKSSTPQLGDELESELKDAIVNQDSLESGEQPSNAPIQPSSDTVKERMRGILSRQIQKTPLNISISAKDPVDHVIGAKLYSDSFGMFEISLMTPYEPSFVVVESALDTNVVQVTPTTVIPEHGISIITDIDDTVRETGVLGDKREVFRNVFSKPFGECEIPGMRDWLAELHTDYNAAIHYVSNSPWQIYNIVSGFLDYFNFPVSSIHLRQYSGNLISSFTQPSAERKRPSMVNLMNDFPLRKFILIGDSGEQDLEAYMSLLPTFEHQIYAIYIRVVPGSLSSNGNDDDALIEFTTMLQSRSDNASKFWNNPTGVDSDGEIDDPIRKGTISKTLNDIPAMGIRKSVSKNVSEATNELINTTIDVGVGVGVAVASTDARGRLAPLVPKKPAILQGKRLRRKSTQDENLPDDEPQALVRTRTRSWSKERMSNILKMGERIYPRRGSDVESLTDAIPPPLPKRAARIVEDQPLSAQSKDSAEASSKSGSSRSTDYRSCKEELPNQYEVVDKRRMLWRAKVQQILNEVPPSIDVKLWVDVSDVHDDSIKVILKEVYKG